MKLREKLDIAWMQATRSTIAASRLSRILLEQPGDDSPSRNQILLNLVKQIWPQNSRLQEKPRHVLDDERIGEFERLPPGFEVLIPIPLALANRIVEDECKPLLEGRAHSAHCTGA